MAEHNQVGFLGEKLAQDLIRKKGYEILDTNWRFQKAEIDIIAKNQNQIIFIEVKTRSSSKFGKPKEAVSDTKQKTLIKAANAYVLENEIDLESRFDVISIISNKDLNEIEHIEDAFYPLL